MKATIKNAFLTFALMCSMGMSASGTDNNTVKKRIQYGPSLMSATCSSDDAAPVLKAKSVKANVGVIANEGYIINAVIGRNRQTLWGGCTDANPKLLLNDT